MHISVHFPKTCVSVIPAGRFFKLHDILKRIAEENTDFVGKVFFSRKAMEQLGKHRVKSRFDGIRFFFQILPYAAIAALPFEQVFVVYEK